jgi:hypothetical protein
MKFAYPNNDGSIAARKSYDLGKWMAAMKDIYLKVHKGDSRHNAIALATSDWNQVEKVDFYDWLKFYESGAQNSYKMAQHNYYINDSIPDYFIPNPPKKDIPAPIKDISKDISTLPNEVLKLKQEVSAEEKRKRIEDQRRKLMGRLNSVEKLLASEEGYLLVGDELEKLLQTIYDLKIRIQKANKLSLSEKTYIDLLISKANYLAANNCKKSSNLLYKIAQNVPNGNFNISGPPVVSKIDGGGFDGLENDIPKDLGKSPPNLEDGEESGIDKFLEKLQTSGLTDLKEDDNKADDTEPGDEVDLEDDVDFDNHDFEDELVAEAQAIPAENQVKAPPKPAKELEVSEDEIPAKQNEKDFDALIDSAFSNITVQDVIIKLEQVSNIFKQRQFTRELTIIDLMLNKLGLSSFFTNLAEATNKSLDASTYILTRLDDIQSKLRGAIGSDSIDLEGNNMNIQDPELLKIRKNLQSSEQKEKDKKEMRKKVEDDQLLNKQKPELEVENVPGELSSPAQPKTEKPAPTPPPAAPSTV